MVEQSIPLAQQAESVAQMLLRDLLRFRDRAMNLDEFKRFCDELEEFLKKVADDSNTIRSNLSDVLIAQDYQDLTGQMIRRVITLVQDVEDNLVGLIKMSGDNYATTERKPAVSNKSDKKETLEGPQMNAEENPEVVASQDDVDDLLSSLGF